MALGYCVKCLINGIVFSNRVKIDDFRFKESVKF